MSLLFYFSFPIYFPSSQFFVDHSDFKRITDQVIIYDALVSIQELINRSLVQHSPTIKNWCIFADSILKIIKDRRSAQAACEHADVHPPSSILFTLVTSPLRFVNAWRFVEFVSESGIPMSRC